ncbi:MAG: GAF domain-containing protein [Chloroflexi bacterium]|nr:GAF domain-containing protein [Chloroflexota bacterium]
MANHPDSTTLRALQLDNNRLREENQTLRGDLLRMEQTVRALTNIQQSLDLINPQTNVFALLNGLLTAALAAVDSEDGSLLLLDEEKNELLFAEVLGGGREALRGYRIPADQGIAGWVVAHRAPELVADVRQEPRFSPAADQYSGFRTSSLICVPMLHGERRLGAIEVVNKRNEQAFDERDLDVLLLVARLASMALLRAEGAAPGG